MRRGWCCKATEQLAVPWAVFGADRRVQAPPSSVRAANTDYPWHDGPKHLMLHHQIVGFRHQTFGPNLHEIAFDDCATCPPSPLLLPARFVPAAATTLLLLLTAGCWRCGCCCGCCCDSSAAATNLLPMLTAAAAADADAGACAGGGYRTACRVCGTWRQDQRDWVTLAGLEWTAAIADPEGSGAHSAALAEVHTKTRRTPPYDAHLSGHELDALPSPQPPSASLAQPPIACMRGPGLRCALVCTHKTFTKDSD